MATVTQPRKGMQLYATVDHPFREEGELVGTVTNVFANTLNFKHKADLYVDSLIWKHPDHVNKFYEWR